MDRLPSIPHHSKITPTNIRVSDEYLAVIASYLKEYLLKETDDDLNTLKDLCQNA